jgi:hypothetical protein
MVNLMIHENENIPESNQQLREAKKISIKVQYLIEGGKGSAVLGAQHQDVDCCLICGDADYHEENLIYYCEFCQLSVHQNCYGLRNRMDQTKQFLCMAC